MKCAKDVVTDVAEVKRYVTEGNEKSVMTRAAFEEIVGSVDRSMDQVKGAELRMQELMLVIDEIGKATQRVALSADSLNDTANAL